MQQKLSALDQVIYIKALNEILAKKAKNLTTLIDNKLFELGIAKDTPVDKVIISYEQAANLMLSYLEDFVEVHEISRQLYNNVSAQIAQFNIQSKKV